MKVLLLGGTAESRQLATQLIEQCIPIIFSIAGLVRKPNLPCPIRQGGFSDDKIDGITGMADTIRTEQINVVIDATHPYAAQISHHAMSACEREAIPYWRLQRPGWEADQLGNHQWFNDLEELFILLTSFKRPFMALGQSIVKQIDKRPPHQHWIIRSVQSLPPSPHYTAIKGIGPFAYHSEVELMRSHQVDALVCKNSGSELVAAKLRAAQFLNLPIFVQRRPQISTTGPTFKDVDEIISALSKHTHKVSRH